MNSILRTFQESYLSYYTKENMPCNDSKDDNLGILLESSTFSYLVACCSVYSLNSAQQPGSSMTLTLRNLTLSGTLARSLPYIYLATFSADGLFCRK